MEVGREQTNHRGTEEVSYGGINGLSDCRTERKVLQYGKI